MEEKYSVDENVFLDETLDMTNPKNVEQEYRSHGSNSKISTCTCYRKHSDLQTKVTNGNFRKELCNKCYNTSVNKNMTKKYLFQNECGKCKRLRCGSCGLLETVILNVHIRSADDRGVTSRRQSKAFGIANVTFGVFVSLLLFQNIL